MADNKNVQTPKKADLILQRQRELSAKQEEALNQSKISNGRMNTALEQIAGARDEINFVIHQGREMQATLQTEYEALMQEFKLIAMQSESIFNALSDKVKELNNVLEERGGAPVVTAAEGAPVYAATQDIDYDLLVDKLIARLPVQDAAPVQAIDYDLLADKLAQRMPMQEVAATSALPVNVSVADRAIDYEYLADKIASRLPAQEYVSPDYIASKVAEQIVIPSAQELSVDTIAEKVAEQIIVPEVTAEVDSDTIAELVADRLGTLAAGDIDYDYLAAKVAQQIEIPEVQNYTAASYADGPVQAEINEDELADAIALRVGSLKPEDFEIIVDDEGCESISKEIIERLDYDSIATAVAEKLREASLEEEEEETDYDELAARISEKITVAGVNEDVIADKAAAAMSNYLPEFDTDEIADKVAEQLINSMPAITVDSEEITNAVASRLIEAQQDSDYEIVIDEEGVDRMSDSVSEKVYQTNDERFTAIDNEIAEIKELIQNLQIVQNVVISPVEEEETVEEEYVEEVVEEEPVEEEDLVTVTDVIEEVEEPVEEEPEQVEETEEIEEITEPEPLVPDTEEAVEEQVDSVPEVAETTPPVNAVVVESDSESDDDNDNDNDTDSDDGDGEEGEGGVDFLNMMRYNRSFIARIIQSTDEQKNYYGKVRNALLSYRKVNSNIAWGAERFHKGRETIARFKIRGKTLVLYMAIDPKEIEYSVYHQKDVSNNKSLHGTPTMIKIMSPRGVKKAVRLVDYMLEKRDGIKRNVPERDYAAMYPYETIEELIEDGLVKDVNKDK
ncbi:MAG: hypothetical protein K2K38_02555 [Clostridia bacterium]|nr:hypothetical protein [Clostridia bacterium]